MSMVFLQHPLVIALSVLAFLSALFAARVRRAAALSAGLCVVCTVAMVLSALACAVPYGDILLLLLTELLLFSIVSRERKT